MNERMQYSLKAMSLAIAVWGLVLSFRAALPFMILFSAVFLVLSISLILGPLRLALDAVDRFATRLKGERLD